MLAGADTRRPVRCRASSVGNTSVAKKHWMKDAFKNAHGQFKAKAEKAGKSTREFAEEKKGAGGLTGKQANLALAGMGANHSRAEKRYGKKC